MTKPIFKKKKYLKWFFFFLLVSHPIRLRGESGVYDLYWDQPPRGDRDVMALLLRISAAYLVYTGRAAPQQLKPAYTGRDKATVENYFRFVSARHK